ncbi:MAG TPA: flagellar motor switch protein FliM [Burkholderiaceae bacterium]
MDDVLSQDEIDALLHGVDSGEVDTQPPAAPGEVRRYDLASQDRIVRGRLPTLEMINERFAREFRVSLFNMLRRSPEVSIRGIDMLKFSEYVQKLLVPTNLNLIRVAPLRGTALLVLEPQLVFTLVDNYFGGDGRYQSKIEGREFTVTEMRVIQLLLQLAFKDLTEAWSPVVALSFEHLQSEMNPHFANIVSPSEVVAVSRFAVNLDGSGGELQLALPYAMIEPIRDQLEIGLQSDRNETDERWSHAFREQIRDASVELSSVLAQPSVTLYELMRLKAGDILPIDMPDELELCVDELPFARGKLGVASGNAAIKIHGFMHDAATQALH